MSQVEGGRAGDVEVVHNLEVLAMDRPHDTDTGRSLTAVDERNHPTRLVCHLWARTYEFIDGDGAATALMFPCARGGSPAKRIVQLPKRTGWPASNFLYFH